MASQKIENLLNLALDATQEEREKSLELDVGYNPIEREWDLIVKYSGNLDKVRELASQVVELQNEYAIITIRESLIVRLAGIPEVEYIEKPKRLFFQVANGKRVSCIDAVQDARFALFGQGVLVAVIDSGIDYENADFRNEDGTTRIRALWDQSQVVRSVTPENPASMETELSERAEEGRGGYEFQLTPPRGYAMGVEYTQEQINEALRQPTIQARRQIVPSMDTSGHGTAVAGIAAGNGRNSGGQYAGVAPQSELIVVKLGSPRQEGFPRTTELMQGIDYVIRKALEFGMPVAINISFGNTYGSHDGTSLLERFIDDLSNIWKNCICIGSGNEAASAGHTSGILTMDQEAVIQLAVQNNQPALSIQIWKEYTDVIDISLVNPSGVRVGPIQEILGSQRFTVGQTEILLYYGEPSPYSTAQEIYIDMLPKDSYITGGVWQIVLTPKKIVSGAYELWLPSEGILNRGTGFLYPTDNTTLTIPSTASRVIAVGAYNPLNFAYADFSGRGYTRETNLVKPDIVAPGVDITTSVVGGGYAQFTGTSFATPFATGGAALLMEWGIVRGNDPYLYGEKVKAYFRRGARPLPGFAEYPNPQVGYGALCVRDSLPI
ncbi:S8 family peptidase [Bariatricus sp. SGI.154]|uniref:S8 family peptidase n=1 Tax=Bariatricus sp. SGI.154 TaxID=3420549 RepID=UPI003D054DBF